jgi:hypothetical protein
MAPRHSVRGGALDVGALLVGLAVLAAWMHFAATRPLTWDEVDYVRASSFGGWANLVDRGAMGPVTFARFALAKARHGDAAAVAASAGYVEERDLLELRHWHPPVGLLPMRPAVLLAGSERGARLTQLAWTVALALLLLGVLRDVAPERPGVRALALLLVLLDPLTRHAVLEAHVHVAIAAAFLLPVWAWVRVVRDPLESRRLGALREDARPGPPAARLAGWAGAAVLGLALGVLCAVAVIGPLWAVLWVLALLAHRDARAWLGRDRGWPWLLLGWLAALLVLWPGAFVRLALAQTWALRIYQVLFQGGREYATAGSELGVLLRASPSLLVFAAVGCAALGVGLLRGRRDALGAGAAAVAFLLVMLPFSIIDRYLLALLPLAAVAGASLAGPGDPERTYPAAREIEEAAAARGERRAARWAAPAVGLAVLACWLVGSGFPYPQRASADALRAEYARVDSLAAAGRDVLAEGGHIFRFYAPRGADRVRSVLVDYDGRRLLRRGAMRYDTVSADEDAVIVLQRRGGAEPEIFATLAARCRREDLPTHVHFACGGVGR